MTEIREGDFVKLNMDVVRPESIEDVHEFTNKDKEVQIYGEVTYEYENGNVRIQFANEYGSWLSEETYKKSELQKITPEELNDLHILSEWKFKGITRKELQELKSSPNFKIFDNKKNFFMATTWTKSHEEISNILKDMVFGVKYNWMDGYVYLRLPDGKYAYLNENK